MCRCLALGLVALGGLSCRAPAPQATAHFDFIEELALGIQRGPATADGGEEVSRARAEGDTLLIPAGVRLHFALELPAAARIVFEGVRPRGAQGGALRVSVTPHAGDSRLLARLQGERGRTELDWQAEVEQVVRLTLAVEKQGDGMAIRRPAIWVEAADGKARLPRRSIAASCAGSARSHAPTSWSTSSTPCEPTGSAATATPNRSRPRSTPSPSRRWSSTTRRPTPPGPSRRSLRSSPACGPRRTGRSPGRTSCRRPPSPWRRLYATRATRRPESAPTRASPRSSASSRASTG